MLIRKLLIPFCCVTFAWVLPVSAHHSHGNYILDTYVEFEGTVREVHWINPHIWIHLEIEDDNGDPQLWAIEGGSIAAVTRRGWTRADVAPGDTINVRCHQLRDFSQGCLLGFVTTEGGLETEFD